MCDQLKPHKEEASSASEEEEASPAKKKKPRQPVKKKKPRQWRRSLASQGEETSPDSEVSQVKNLALQSVSSLLLWHAAV